MVGKGVAEVVSLTRYVSLRPQGMLPRGGFNADEMSAYIKTRMKRAWMASNEADLVPQLNNLTLKLPGSGYPEKYGLTLAQTTAARHDYLWLNYAIICTNQFQAESKNRAEWKNKLKGGPPGGAVSTVPSVGSEFSPPGVPVVLDGVIPRFRILVNYLKNHPNYEVADGIDLDIEGTEEPSPAMKPTAAVRATGPTTVRHSVRKETHEAVDVYCRRGTESTAIKLGRYTRARFDDRRPNLVPGHPECREYTYQYVDNDEPVGEVSDVVRVITSGILAA